MSLDLSPKVFIFYADSAILHKIWFAISSYKISMKRQNRKFEHVSKKTRNVKDHVSLLKKNFAVLKETIIELEVSKARLQGEQSTVRYGIPILETHSTSLDFMIPFRNFVIGYLSLKSFAVEKISLILAQIIIIMMLIICP